VFVYAGRRRGMRRFRVFVAGVVVAAMPLVTSQVAWAGTPGRVYESSSKFCATAQRLQTEIQDLHNVDIASLTVSSAKSTYRRFVNLIKQLQKETPRELKAEFRRLRRLYQRVVDGKLRLRNLPDAISTAGDDLSTIFNYLEDQCGVTFQSPPTTT
jgi:hypothetical protein